MPHTLAIARCWYETSSFTPIETTLNQFYAREWVVGQDAASFYRGTRTEIGAVVDFLAQSKSWAGVFLRCCAASPGGPVVEADLQCILDEIVAGVDSTKPDAVYLSLHGALFGQKTLCADLQLVRRVRTVIGSRPLAVTFDLHGNISPEVARYVDIAVGYKTYPHVDMYESAERALMLLDATIRRRIRPVVAIRKIGAILPSFNMRTESGPMAEIEAIARAAQAGDSRILDVSPFGGFAYADTPCAGAAVSVTVDGERTLADRVARNVSGEMKRRVSEFGVKLPAADVAIRDALKMLSTRADQRPIAVTEPSDNQLSGGAGDCPGLLRAMLALAGETDAVFAFFWDPPLIKRCYALGEGQTIRTELGGRLERTWGEPVALTARIELLTPGRYRNSGPMETGLPVELGRTVVLRQKRLRVIVTENCQPPNDPEYFTLHNVNLDNVGILAVKAKNHFRAAFTPLCGAIIEADTPGPAMADLSKLPFRNLPLELYAGIGIPR